MVDYGLIRIFLASKDWVIRFKAASSIKNRVDVPLDIVRAILRDPNEKVDKHNRSLH